LCSKALLRQLISEKVTEIIKFTLTLCIFYQFKVNFFCVFDKSRIHITIIKIIHICSSLLSMNSFKDIIIFKGHRYIEIWSITWYSLLLYILQFLDQSFSNRVWFKTIGKRDIESSFILMRNWKSIFCPFQHKLLQCNKMEWWLWIWITSHRKTKKACSNTFSSHWILTHLKSSIQSQITQEIRATELAKNWKFFQYLCVKINDFMIFKWTGFHISNKTSSLC
jgi:hypothetical protein